jgi:hypothetical protein
MNLFTRNSPYCHLLKYLLFLPKHPVYLYVCLKSASSGRAMYPCHHVWNLDVEKIVYVHVQRRRESSKTKKRKLMPAIQCSAVFLYWGLQLCLLRSTSHVIASIVYRSFFFAIVRAVCLSWLSVDFAEQNACRIMKSNWGVPLIGTYVREQMAKFHVTLRCVGIEQGLSLPTYDVLIPHRVSMKRNHHDELQSP